MISLASVNDVMEKLSGESAEEMGRTSETLTSPEGTSPAAQPGAPGERLRAVHEQILARHAVGGSPAGSAEPGGTDPGTVAPPQDAPGIGVVPPPFDPGTVEKAVRTLCGTVDRFVVRRTYAAAIAVSKDDTLSKTLANDVAMQPDERDLIASLSETVCMQYNLAGQHTPAILLGVAVVGYATRTAFVLSKVDALAKTAAAERKNAREEIREAA